MNKKQRKTQKILIRTLLLGYLNNLILHIKIAWWNITIWILIYVKTYHVKDIIADIFNNVLFFKTLNIFSLSSFWLEYLLRLFWSVFSGRCSNKKTMSAESMLLILAILATRSFAFLVLLLATNHLKDSSINLYRCIIEKYFERNMCEQFEIYIYHSKQ